MDNISIRLCFFTHSGVCSVVSLAGDFNWATFSQKLTWEDFIGDSTLDFCLMLSKK